MSGTFGSVFKLGQVFVIDEDAHVFGDRVKKLEKSSRAEVLFNLKRADTRTGRPII